MRLRRVSRCSLLVGGCAGEFVGVVRGVGVVLEMAPRWRVEAEIEIERLW